MIEDHIRNMSILKPGEEYIYFTGPHLFVNSDAQRVGKCARRLYDQGCIELRRRKVGEVNDISEFEYIAVGRGA